MTSKISEMPEMPQTVVFDAQGLVPVVAQEEQTGEVLLLAYMNAEALGLTLAEGVLVLWSRSRGRLWRKGEQSGHTLQVREVRLNCEGNSLLARVRLAGPGACHEGYRSCYFRRLEVSAADGTLDATVVEPRAFDPALVYAPGGTAPQDEATAAQALERDLRALYLGYTWLRDAELIAGSRTSALLHAPDTAATAQQTVARAQEELNELRGVLAGTHTHGGGADDVLLEASQVGYWALLAAVATRHSYDEWQPHAAWLAGWNGAAHATPSDATLAACARALMEAGALCRAAGVHPARAVAVDLAALRAKYTL